MCLQGTINHHEVESISATHLHNLLKRNEVSCCYMLQIINTTNSIADTMPIPAQDTPEVNMTLCSLQTQAQQVIPEIEKLLSQFPDIFTEPKQLPLKRIFDHQIPLEPNARPVNVRPYRFPYFQRNEIEQQVWEMLQAGIIQTSTS